MVIESGRKVRSSLNSTVIHNNHSYGVRENCKVYKVTVSTRQTLKRPTGLSNVDLIINVNNNNNQSPNFCPLTSQKPTTNKTKTEKYTIVLERPVNHDGTTDTHKTRPIKQLIGTLSVCLCIYISITLLSFAAAYVHQWRPRICQR